MTQPTKPEGDLGQTAREILTEFLEDANRGQQSAIAAAAKRALLGEKAAPLRQLAREIDDLNGNLFSRAIASLLPPRRNGQ